MTPQPRHRVELRRQLMIAAEQQAGSARERSPSSGRLVAAAALLVISLVGALVLTIRGEGPAGAETFQLTRDGEAILIDVIGRVEDPNEAARELLQEGLEVELVAVPVPPWLVGEVVSATNVGGDAEVGMADGTVESIRLSGRIQLTLRFGRPADQGEAYEATSSAPGCRDFVGDALSDVVLMELMQRFGPQLRWQETGRSGVRELTQSEISPDAKVTDIIPTSLRTAIVIVSEDGEPPPPGLSCTTG